MSKTNEWISVSDLMTGLMVIFLFISIAYIKRVQDNQTTLTDYVKTKMELHEKLIKEFKGDTAQWQMSIGKDLSMKFKNPSVLFSQGSFELTPDFKTILDNFLPRYINILLKDSLRNNIQEIRIEGHTDDVPIPSYDQDPYIANVILSQQRALSVLRHFRSSNSFQKYSPEEKQLLEFWFTSNGLSFGRALDRNNQYILKSKMDIDKAKSRRVEFRIVTQGDAILEKFVKKNK